MDSPKLIVTPFAELGAKNDIPETGASEPQFATMSAGWPAITETPINEGGVPPDRKDFNGLGHLTTSHLAFLNRGQTYQYDATFANQIGGYPLHARIMLTSGDIVQCTTANNTNDPNVNMTGWRDQKNVDASNVTDESGLNQQEVNDLLNDRSSSLSDFYSDDYGSAFNQAYNYAKSKNINTIFIKNGTYDALTTATLNLTSDFKIIFDSEVRINAVNQIDIHNFTLNRYFLSIEGNNLSITPAWSTHNPSIENSAFVIDSKTFSKSIEMNNIQVLLGNRDYNTGFYHAVKSIGLNYSLLNGCLFQAQQSFFCESNPDSFRSMGSNLVDCFLMSSGSCIVLKNNGVLACEGWSFKGGEYLSHTDGITVLDNTTYSTYNPPLLHIIGVHIASRRFFNLTGISRVIVSSCDLQAEITTDTSYNGLIELEGVQVFSICGGTVISQTGATTGASEPEDSKPVLYIRKSERGRISAHIEIGNIQPWLYQNAPMVTFDSDINFAGKVKIARVTQGEFVGPFCANGFSHLVTISDDTVINNNSLVGGFAEGSCIFNSSTGVLELNSPPSIGNYYLASASVVPAGSTINQIKVPYHIGKDFFVRFESDNIRISNNSNLFTPAYTEILITKAGIISVQSFNSDWCQIISVPLSTLIVDSGVPLATSSAGVHGQKVYSSGFMYEYLAGVGWLKIAAVTF